MPNPLIERMARAAYCAQEGIRECDNIAHVNYWFSEELCAVDGDVSIRKEYEEIARAALAAIQEPSEEQWDGLARQIILWMDMTPKTPRTLFAHLKASGYDIPQWLRDEPEMERLDHVPSKGTRAVMIYKAMLDGALN